MASWLILAENLMHVFKPQITLCHDNVIEHTYYTNHTIFGLNLDARSTGSRRPGFKEGSGFFSKSSANNAYKRSSQRSTILSRCHNCSFVSRGHLSPRADFIYEEWQDATFYYINAVPQWVKFNTGNWAAVESAIRQLASTLKQNIQVQTGTYQTVTLNDHDSLTLTSKNTIPVPLYVWKLIYDAVHHKAMVFVSFNFVTREAVVNSLCPQQSENLCEEYLWSFPNRKKVSKGLVYCCSYQSFKQKIPWIQDIPNDVGILPNKI